MPSRLSSLLVRDGLVGVKRMEKAFQRQVIYGGSLDTTLLEMGLVSEDRLTQYLALTSGLPPANRAECNVFDAGAVRACPQEIAVKYRVVPLQFEAGSLRVLVHDPVDMAALEELADELDVALQPLIVPEYRWHVVFTRNYGGQPTARYSTLARAAETASGRMPAIESIREGEVVGDHLVSFEGRAERLELRHSAGDRDIFAAGALEAALRLAGRSARLWRLPELLFGPE